MDGKNVEAINSHRLSQIIKNSGQVLQYRIMETRFTTEAC